MNKQKSQEREENQSSFDYHMRTLLNHTVLTREEEQEICKRIVESKKSII